MAALSLCLVGAACSRGPEVGLAVVPGGQPGAHSAELRITSTDQLENVTVTFEIPEGCEVTGGTLERRVGDVTADRPADQRLLFQCPASQPGRVEVDLAWGPAEGKRKTRHVEAQF